MPERSYLSGIFVNFQGMNSLVTMLVMPMAFQY
jgi:hypothetical protein